MSVKEQRMRAIGCVLMISGWLIALAALVLLTRIAQRYAFVLAGIGVEALGLALLAQSYRAQQRPSAAGGRG